jgi:hypothetical protein
VSLLRSLTLYLLELRFKDFPWTVPVSHAVLLMIPGAAVGDVKARGRISATQTAGILAE